MGKEKDSKTDFIKYLIGLLVGALLTGAVDVFWVNPIQIKQQVEATKAMEQEAIVKALSERFDFVDLNSDYEDAIEKIYKKYDDAIKKATETESSNNDLNQQLAELQNDTATSKAVDRAKAYAENGEYGLAIDTLSGVSVQTVEITSLINSYGNCSEPPTNE